jgi:hypothetical protein
MALVITEGGASSDSYASVADADTYISLKYEESQATIVGEWEDLEVDAKEHRLKLAALLLNTFAWRGEKACRNQRLAFPRWWRWDDGYPLDEDTYLDYADITGYTPPTTPQEVIDAQFEVAIQVIHSGILAADFLAFPEKEIRSFGLGGSLEIEFFGGGQYASTWSKARVASLDVIELLLERWLARVSGEVV